MIYGRSDWNAMNEVSLAGGGVVHMNTVRNSDTRNYLYGLAVADVNDDGYDDIVASAQVETVEAHAYSGKFYVVYFKYGMDRDIFIAEANPQILTVEGDYEFGPNFRHMAIGDFDGDHLQDIFASGHINSSSRPYRKKDYVIYGVLFQSLPEFRGVLRLRDDYLDVIQLIRTSRFDGSQVDGYWHMRGADLHSIPASADMNGDGYDDLIHSFHRFNRVMGDPYFHGCIPEIYVVFGANEHCPAQEYEEMQVPKCRFVSPYYDDGTGLGIHKGDLNGDGFDDIIAQAYENRFTVVFGNHVMPDSTILSPGFEGGFMVWNGFVYACGDLDGDGYDDIIGHSEGRIFIIPGRGIRRPMMQEIIHPLPGSGTHNYRFDFTDGTGFGFRFLEGKPVENAALHLTNFGGSLPDSLSGIPAGSGAVSFYRAEFSGGLTPFELECSLAYSDSLLNVLGIRESDLTVAYFDEVNSAWSKIPSVIDGDRDLVTFTTSHLSYFALTDTANHIVAGVEEIAAMPATFELCQNYPNPFNPVTTIKFQLPGPTIVSLRIYNLLGQEIRTLINGNMTSGVHEAVWDGRDDAGLPAASGIYFYRIQAGEENISTKKMLLIR